MYTYHQIKKYLLLKQKEVVSKLRSLDQETALNEVAPESLELGTSSWQADMESTKQAVKQRLLQYAQNIQKTLLKLKKGTYGLCERCKKGIEKERLKILPTATLCIACIN